MSLNDLPGEKERGLALTSGVYLGIVRAALVMRPAEMCGVLYKRTEFDSSPVFSSLRNVSDRPLDSFTVDPGQQKDMRARFRLVGLVHSHPNGEARPSDRDRESWVEDGWWYLVVGLGSGVPVVGCYRMLRGSLVKRKLAVL